MPMPFAAGDINLKLSWICIFFQNSLHFPFCQASGDWKLSWDAGTAQGSVASASEGTARCGTIVRALRDVDGERLRGPFLSLQAVSIRDVEGQTRTLALSCFFFFFSELVRSSPFFSISLCVLYQRHSSPRHLVIGKVSGARCFRRTDVKDLKATDNSTETEQDDSNFASCQHYPSCGNRSTQSHCWVGVYGLSTTLISWQQCFFLSDSFSFFSPRSSIADFVPNIGNIFSGFGNLFRWQKANWIRAVRELCQRGKVRQDATSVSCKSCKAMQSLLSSKLIVEHCSNYIF